MAKRPRNMSAEHIVSLGSCVQVLRNEWIEESFKLDI